MKYNYAILGLGLTGYSCVEYLLSQHKSFFVLDDRAEPPYLNKLKENYPDVELHLGKGNSEKLLTAEKIIISPGLPLTHEWIVYAKAHAKSVVTDISLFIDNAKAPVVLVTGSNGKSTVVKLVGHLASIKFTVLIGGNYGIPALDLLKEPAPDYYVLELSSFQLISTDNIHSFAAVVLNITPNHLDWHTSMPEYVQAKLKVYQDCKHPVVMEDVYKLYSAQLPPIVVRLPVRIRTSSRGLSAGSDHLKMDPADKLRDDEEISHKILSDLSIFTLDAAQETILFNNQKLMATRELPLPGKAYYPNVLAAFNLAYYMGVSPEDLTSAVKTFQGLPHRCELIATEGGCYWYNDSKATTLEAVTAAVTAIKSKHHGRIILILSGLMKGVDLSPLKQAISDKIDFLILLGQAVWPYQQLFADTPSFQVSTMEEVVTVAQSLAKPQDVVLFSPAGASFDLFKNYQHRGDVFSTTVRKILCLDKTTVTNI